MCTVDIDAEYTYIDYVYEIIEAFEASYAALNIQPQPLTPDIQIEDGHTAEKAIIQCLIDLRGESSLWNGVLSTTKFKGVVIKLEEFTPEEDPNRFDEDEADSMAYVDASPPYASETVPIVYNRMSMKEAAVTMGVTYEEVFAETMIHEFLHIYHEDAGTPDYHGSVINQEYMDSEVPSDTHAIYAEVFEDPAPLLVWWNAGDPEPAPSNTIPRCLIDVFNNHSAFNDTVTSGRAATMVYPTYRFHWRSGPNPHIPH